MKFQILFSRKNITNLSSAESAYNNVSVNSYNFSQKIVFALDDTYEIQTTIFKEK